MLTWHGFKCGDKVLTTVQTTGETSDGVEVVYSANTPAIVSAIAFYGKEQGWGIEVTIGENGREIVNYFDDRDVKELGGVPFLRAG